MATVRRLTFAERLRQHRHDADLTQAALAERAGLSLRAVSDIERGLKRPQTYTVGRLADALGLSGPERAAFEASARERSVPLAPGSTTPVADPARASSPLGSLPPLVGRARELALLTRHLSPEVPSLLALAGEPGIGKSRLLAEAGALARAAGWRVLAGGCTRRSGQQPYAPFVDLLAQAIASSSPARQKHDLAGCSWLARLLPELVEARAVPDSQWRLPAEQERRLIFGAVARYAANVAGPAGTLLVLDDLQWAGSDALDLLESLARISSAVASGSSGEDASVVAGAIPVAAPIRVLIAYRDTEVRPEHPLAMLIADLAREGLAATHQLAPIGDDEAKELAQQLLDGGQPRAEDTTNAGEDLAREIAQRTGGRPFFVVSCAQAALAAHDDRPMTTQAETALRVPWNVSASIRQRIAMLPTAAQDVIGVAAVAGRHASRDILLHVGAQMGMAHPELIAALEAADRAHLLLAAGSDGYEFAHDLVREVVAADLSPARAAALHGWVGDALERAPEHKRQPAELAWHFQQAGQLARALPYALLAGDRAEAVYAHAEAEKHYRAAVEMAREAGDPAREVEALEKLGAALHMLGRGTEAGDCYKSAITRYQAVADLAGELRIWGSLLDIVDPAPLASVLALAQSVREDDCEPPVLQALAVLYNSLAQHADSPQAALAASGRAEQIARRLGDDALLVQALSFHAQARWDLGEDALQMLLDVVPLAERVGDLSVLSYSLTSMGGIYLHFHADLPRAKAYLEQSLDAAKRRGGPYRVVLALLNLAEYYYFVGEWCQCRKVAMRADSTMRGIDRPVWPSLMRVRGMLDLAEGRFKEAEQHLSQGLAQTEVIGGVVARRGMQCLLAERDLVQNHAASAYERVGPLLEPYDLCAWSVYPLLPLAAWALLALDRDEEAAATLAQCRARCGKLWLVDALRVEALLAIKQRRWEDAATSLDESLAMCRAMPYPYAEAKALYVYGQLHVAKGNVPLAREMYQAALAICERLGEGLYRPHVEHALAGLS